MLLYIMLYTVNFKLYTVQGIRLKLEAAQRHDKPRWGDYPDKLNLEYIQGNYWIFYQNFSFQNRGNRKH